MLRLGVEPTPLEENFPEANAPTEGALLSPAGSELRRSPRRTAGKFQTARYDDSFLDVWGPVTLLSNGILE
jgi:hypothetical protein